MSSFWSVSILVLSLSVSDRPSSYYYRASRGRQGVKTKQLAWCDALPSSDYSTHNDHNLVVCHINCSGRKSGEARPWSLFLIATEPLTLWKSWRTDFLPWVALFNYIIFLLLNYGTLPFPNLHVQCQWVRTTTATTTAASCYTLGPSRFMFGNNLDVWVGFGMVMGDFISCSQSHLWLLENNKLERVIIVRVNPWGGDNGAGDETTADMGQDKQHQMRWFFAGKCWGREWQYEFSKWPSLNWMKFAPIYFHIVSPFGWVSILSTMWQLWNVLPSMEDRCS